MTQTRFELDEYTIRVLLLFNVEFNENNIIFVDILNWDNAYKRSKK